MYTQKPRLRLFILTKSISVEETLREEAVRHRSPDGARSKKWGVRTPEIINLSWPATLVFFVKLAAYTAQWLGRRSLAGWLSLNCARIYGWQVC